MTFLNWALLAGVLAASVPLIIHLFNRSRFKVVEWGAMHLLQSVVRVNRKRIKIEQLILLLIRCAIPVILALCMARPVITGWKSLTGESPSSTVVLLDASYSMQAGGAGRTHFDAAREAADGIIGRLKRGSEVAVVVMGSGAEPLTDKPTFDPPGMTKLVNALKPGFGPVDTDFAIDTATGVLAKATHAKRDLVLISDFQQNNWAQMTGPATKRLSELIAGSNVPPSVTFVPVATGSTANVSVDGVELSRPIVGVGQELRVRAHITNHAATPRANLRVFFRVDDEQKEIAEITLAPNEQRQVLFTHKFAEAGSHLIAVEAAADELAADNRFTTAVPVLDKLPVLLVDGDPSNEPLASETAFLEIALAPYTTGKTELADLITAKTVTADKLKPDDLAEQSVVILANVPRLGDEAAAALGDFVRRGGSLLIFPGNRVDAAWYNRTLAAGASGGDPLMPMTLEAVAGDLNDATKQTSVLAQHFDHPALELFNDPRNGDLTGGEVSVWYRLKPPESPAGVSTTAVSTTGSVGPADRTIVAARLASGDPMLVERPVGDGLVIVCATAADADWSNLPLRPTFLPLMQQLVTYAASRGSEPRNVEVGRPLLAPLDADQVDKKFTLTDAGGDKHELTAVARDRRAVVRFDQTRRPGVYTLMGPGEKPLHFVVHAAADESRLDPLTDEQLEQTAQALGADVVRSVDEYAALDATRRHGREVWRMLLVAVAVLLFAELFLQQWFTRSRTS